MPTTLRPLIEELKGTLDEEGDEKAQNQAFTWLKKALGKKKLDTEHGDKRHVPAKEFMMMAPRAVGKPGQVKTWQFKHAPTRNYVYIAAGTGEMIVPKSKRPFNLGYFDSDEMLSKASFKDALASGKAKFKLSAGRKNAKDEDGFGVKVFGKLIGYVERDSEKHVNVFYDKSGKEIGKPKSGNRKVAIHHLMKLVSELPESVSSDMYALLD